MIEVRQSDRESSNKLCKAIADLVGTMLCGSVIEDAFNAAFAAHRQQAEDAMRERCAKVAANWCGTKEAQGVANAMFASIRINAAIRGIDAGGEGER